MFDTILIPLDESETSRGILDQVKRLPKREDAKVTLLRVLVPLLERSTEREGRVDTEERHLALRREEAERALDEVARALREEGIDAAPKVVLGDPAATILDQVERTSPALVAMSTHGRSGPSRWIRGSVAERVLRRCSAPLLLVNPKGAEASGGRFGRILVALDGSGASASVLPLVQAFAELHGSEILLLRVKDLPVGDYAAPAILATQRLDDLEAWLNQHKAELEQQGLKVRTHAALGDPASEILDTAQREKVDLVAMTTHGASGLERWLFGSVAENVLRHCKAPVLVKRITAAQ